jgi:choice-of-anchor B domain-containing protein
MSRCMKKLFLCLTALFCVYRAAPVAAQSFGASAAIAGDDVLFGQPEIDREPGSVFVYRPSGGSWSEAARLSASDGIPGDRFGSALTADGDRLLVGALWADSGRGAVYVFERGAGGAWREAARLADSDGVRGDSLGVRVALWGDIALVASGVTPDSGESAAVHVFRRDARGAWREAASISVPGLAPGDGFGRTLALGEGYAAISAAARDSATGAVWIFPARGDGWGEPALLVGPAKRSLFGARIAVLGDRLLISAPTFEQGRGAVLVYARDPGGAWTEVERVQTGEPGARLVFGGELAAGIDEVWIGAVTANEFRGAVFRARPEDEGWGLDPIELDGLDLQRGDRAGTVLALGRDHAAVGLPGDDYGAGAGVIFVREGDEWELAARVVSEIAPLAAVVGGPVPCTSHASIFGCRQVDLVAFLPVQSIGGERGVELNDIWGWTDPQTGKEYALVGRVDGTSFVDISDPENPVYVGQLPKTEGAPGSTWRDIKVFRDHAFIVADGAAEHGMQVFDLTRLRNAQNPPVAFTEDAHYDRIHSAHNIVINEDTGFAYTVGNSAGGETCGGGLHMIDIKDPKNPRFVGCFSDPSTGRQKTGYTHDAQCVLYRGPDPDYQGREICFGSNETALSIADVTDKENPRAIAVAEYPNVGYTHQAWLTEDHRHLLMDDELDELNGLVDNTRTLIWDVSDLDDPVLIKEFLNPNTTSIDHNQYVVGDKVFQSNYIAGLRVLDISDIENPREVGYFDTVPYGSDAPRFDGSWSNYPFFKSGVIVVTSGDEGLFLLRYRPEGDRPVS